MNTLKYAPIAFLIFYLGYCEGGFMKDPSVDEIIRGVYAKVPSETEQVVPTGLTMDQHVQRITMEFKGSDGIRKPKLEHLIAGSIDEIQLSGRMDFHGLWGRCMMKPNSAEGTSVEIERHKTSYDRLGHLRSRLYQLCLNADKLSIMDHAQLWSRREWEELGDNFLASEQMVKLAIDFHTLSTIWKGYQFLWTMITQLAICSTSHRFELLSEPQIRDAAGGDEILVGTMTEFSNTVHSKRTEFDREEEFYDWLGRTVPEPYRMSHLSRFPVPNDWIRSCKRENDVITELVTICQEIGPIMSKKGPEFWKKLELVTERENLKPLLMAYQELCEFFRNGFPFDRLFEYHKLISRISREIKRFGDEVTQMTLQAHLDGMIHAQDTVAIDKVQSVNTYKGLTAKDVSNRVLRDKVNLVMNYAEELHQQPNLRPGSGEIHTNLRATEWQLREIAHLLCEVMSLDYYIEFDEVAQQVDYDVSRTNLPKVIKQKTRQFAKFIQEGLEVETDTRIENTPKQPRLRETFMEWDTDLSEALMDVKIAEPISGETLTEALRNIKSKYNLDEIMNRKSATPSTRQRKINEYNASLIHILAEFQLQDIPTKIFPLQDTPTIWEVMVKATEREFSTMLAANAEILISCLRQSQKFIQDLPVLDRIFYFTSQVKSSRRSTIIKKVQSSLKEYLNPKMSKEIEESQKFKPMTTNEINMLEKILELIRLNSKHSHYAVWKQNILPKFLDLPTNLVMILGDMFSDCSRKYLSGKKDFRDHLLGKSWEDAAFYKQIQHRFLSKKAKEELDRVLEALTEASIRKAQEEFMISKYPGQLGVLLASE
ncbi:hypothetical protein Pst134EB_005843 [Puccinia striiformis f. sp. tritici]|nr:hypothetical protein Pst134EB_005843 [Puccinia striiformis f. sp. tritici]